jgi:RNase P subunit RPR2
MITTEDINALPDNIRRFIMELETMADPSGMVRNNMRLEHENKALLILIANKLKGRLQNDIQRSICDT